MPEAAAIGPDDPAADAAAPAGDAVPAATDAAADPFSDLDPFLVPAVRAAAAAKAAAARIRTGVGDLTVREPVVRGRPRHSAVAQGSRGVSLEQATAARAIAFRPRRAHSEPLPYATEYRRRPPTPATADGAPGDPTARALAPLPSEVRFERFRQEVASRNGHAAEDPAEHPWSRTVPVPVNRTEQGRPSRWWHLSRLLGRA